MENRREDPGGLGTEIRVQVPDPDRVRADTQGPWLGAPGPDHFRTAKEPRKEIVN
jgi:hypothetical protein